MKQVMKARTSQAARVSISIRVHPEVAEALKQRALAEERSVSWMAKRALKEFLEAREEEAA